MTPLQDIVIQRIMLQLACFNPPPSLPFKHINNSILNNNNLIFNISFMIIIYFIWIVMFLHFFIINTDLINTLINILLTLIMNVFIFSEYIQSWPRPQNSETSKHDLSEIIFTKSSILNQIGVFMGQS